MSFAENIQSAIKAVYAEHNDEIKKLKDFYDAAIDGKRLAMNTVFNEQLTKLRDGETTGDTVLDTLLRYHPIFTLSDSLTRNIISREILEKQGSEILPIGLDDTDKVTGLIEHNLNLRTLLEENRGKHITGGYRIWTPHHHPNEVSFFAPLISYERPVSVDLQEDLSIVGMLGIIAEDGDVMNVDEKNGIFINTGGKYVERITGFPPYGKKPHMVESDMPYSRHADYELLKEKPSSSLEKMKEMLES